MRTKHFMIRFTDEEMADLSRRAVLDRRTVSDYIRTLIFTVPVPPVDLPAAKPAAINHCKQCGHSWTPKVLDPKQCPECKAYDWNKTRMEAQADREAAHNAEAVAIGVTPDEYQRQIQATNRLMDIEQYKAHSRRWKAVKAAHGVSLETWNAARWMAANTPDEDYSEELFDRAQKELDTDNTK